jgi:small-conductance mechanosensitive channel
VSAPSPLGELTQALAEGLARPRHAWEALAIALALAVAWVLTRALVFLAARRRALRGRAPAGAAARLPRLLFPLLALVLLWAGEGVLRWYRVLLTASDARLLRLAASLIGTLAVARLLFSLLRRVLHSTALIARFERAIGIVAIAGVGLYATGALEDVVAWLSATEIPLGSAATVSLWSILVGSTTTLVSLLAAMWLGSFIEERLNAETTIEPNLRTVLGRVARAILLVVALLVALALSGIDLTILSVFGGALGVGLGLGLQRVASNYVSGFILLLDRSLRIGDLISVDKYYGQVTQISTRYTVLRATDGTEAIVPNEMLVSSPVVNSTLHDNRIVLSVSVAVGPETDPPPVLEMLRKAACTTPRVLPEPPPLAILKEFQGGNLLLEVNFWIGDPENGRQNVQSDVALAIHRRLRAANIPLAVPRGDFHLVADPYRVAAETGAAARNSPTAPSP